jgi:hypothetical protein
LQIRKLALSIGSYIILVTVSIRGWGTVSDFVAFFVGNEVATIIYLILFVAKSNVRFTRGPVTLFPLDWVNAGTALLIEARSGRRLDCWSLRISST